ncbi:hypothetical protein CsatB_020700 [Cannabis sativa]
MGTNKKIHAESQGHRSFALPTFLLLWYPLDSLIFISFILISSLFTNYSLSILLPSLYLRSLVAQRFWSATIVCGVENCRLLLHYSYVN